MELRPPITTVLLAELSDFHFYGEWTEIEWFVAGLITPPLRGFRISMAECLPIRYISHLSKFIREAGIVFRAARLSHCGFDLTISMFAPAHSINGQTRQATFRTPPIDFLESALSPMLATVVDVFLYESLPIPFFGPPLRRLQVAYRRCLFEEFRNVKVLRLDHRLEREFAAVLRQPTVSPFDLSVQEEVDPVVATSSGPTMNSSRSIFDLDIFPSLEKIVVYLRRSGSIGESELVSLVKSFGEYSLARQQVGRPVKVTWSTNQGLPTFYMRDDVGVDS